MSDNRWDAMMIREYTDRTGVARSQWTKIGAAFTNKDGSINVVLDCMPFDGKVTLQVPMTKEEREARFGSHGQAQRQHHQQDYPPRGQPRGQTPEQYTQQQQHQRPQTPQGNAARYANRGASQPQPGGFRPPAYQPPPQAPPYQPDPRQQQPNNPAGYDEHVPMGPPWLITDSVSMQQYEVWEAKDLPIDHPDHVPF